MSWSPFQRRPFVFPPKKEDETSGQHAERAAAFYLESKGWEIKDKNFHSKFGEIDIIGYNKHCTLCFVEVKYRKADMYGYAAEFVDERKQSRIIKTAQYYILRHNIEDLQMQFDVVAISGEEIEHLENAFEALDY